MDTIKITLTSKATPSVTADLKANGIPFLRIASTTLIVPDNPKTRTAIKMVQERFGSRSVIVNPVIS